MRHTIVAGVVVVVTAFGAPPALAIGEFTSGQWAGKAYFKSADFSHCAMLTTQGDWKLLFEINSKGAVRLGVSHKQLSFKKNERKRGVLQVDAEAAVTRTFIAALPQLVVASAGSHAEAERLIEGNTLKVHLGDLGANFNLAGGKAAFAALSNCAAMRGNNGGTSATLPVVKKRKGRGVLIVR